MNINNFLNEMKIKAEAKAKEIKALELSNWSEKTEETMKRYYKYTDKQIQEHKKRLESI